MQCKVRASLVVLVLATLSGLTAPAAASLMQLTSLFVFGDNFSDAGNSGLRSQQYAGSPSAVFPPPPYYNGQYSNGPVAVQQLWNLYNPANPGGFTPSLAGGTDYAIGGSTTGLQNYNAVNPSVPPLLQPAYAQYGAAWQLQQFDVQNPAFDPATSLFVVWLFPNDVFYAVQTGTLPGVVPGSPGDANLVGNGIANIMTTIRTLALDGAQHFLVPNVPDLAETPAF
jgi:phospholipase/lecithinase/hemolysin